MLLSAREPDGEARKASVLVAGSMISNFVGSNTTLTFTLGVFISTFHREFGWGRADISFAMTSFTLVAFFGSAAIGRMADRLAPGRIAAWSMLAFGIGLLATPWLIRDVTSLWVTYAFLAILGLGTTPVVTNRLLIAAFPERHGLAMGLAMTGSGLGGFLLPRLAAELVRADGWRSAFTGLGFLACAAAPLLWLSLGGKVPRAEADRPPGNERIADSPTFAAILRTPALWILSTVAALGGFAMSGPAAHLIPLLGDHSISVSDAAAYASLLGLTSIAGRVITGIALDRFGNPATGSFLMAAGAAGVFVLGQFDIRTALLGALLLGFVIGAEVVILAVFVGRFFSKQSHGVAFGWVYGVMALGSAIGPVAVGILRDRLGDYSLAMMISGSTLALGSLTCLLLVFHRPAAIKRQADHSGG